MVLYTIVLIIHLLVCIALVLVILAQTSKGGLDANLGGAAMNVFGGSGASAFLRKATQILGLVFVVTCVSMAFLVKDMGSVNVNDVQSRQKKIDAAAQDAPKAPAAQPVQPAAQPQ
jgi:preprotein translocase subunit SecG